MDTVELKRELIKRISDIDDAEFLNAIKTLLDYKKKEPYIDLTDKQEEELLMASEEGRKGNYTSQAEMDKKVEQWLKKGK